MGNNALIGEFDLASANAAVNAFANCRKLFMLEIFLDHAKSAATPYRVEGEKIAEHWGFPEKIPPQKEWKKQQRHAPSHPI
jgi:hypothetical protein